EILRLASDIDHAVDGRGAAQYLAARPEDAPVAGAGVGFGLIAPINRRVGKGLAKAERNMDPAVAVLAARLEQDYTRRRIFAQPRRHRATGRPRANNDEIRLDPFLFCRHRRLPFESRDQHIAPSGPVERVILLVIPAPRELR